MQNVFQTLGNHEFDDGVTNLVSYLNGIKDITPTVVSNLNMTAEPELNKLVSTSHVFTINNTKVGVIGYLTTDTPVNIAHYFRVKIPGVAKNQLNLLYRVLYLVALYVNFPIDGT